jgi:hypothetical protein
MKERGEKGVKQMHQIHAFILAFDMHVAKLRMTFFLPRKISS